MWRVTLFLMLGLGCSSPIWADDARSSCSQLAIGIGQFEKVRTVCDTQGIDAGIWQAQLKSLQCSQVLGDDVGATNCTRWSCLPFVSISIIS